MKNNHIKVKIYQSVEVSVAQIATNLAEKDEYAQVELFNKFATGLIKSCEDKHHFELQLIAIGKSLDTDGTRLILELAEFIKLENNQTNGK